MNRLLSFGRIGVIFRKFTSTLPSQNSKKFSVAITINENMGDAGIVIYRCLTLVPGIRHLYIIFFTWPISLSIRYTAEPSGKLKLLQIINEKTKRYSNTGYFLLFLYFRLYGSLGSIPWSNSDLLSVFSERKCGCYFIVFSKLLSHLSEPR